MQNAKQKRKEKISICS